jgi:pantetheine-phosphate adenylyltransferase
MYKVACPGTYDLVTHGHMCVFDEARNVADWVVVYIADNPLKQCQFAAEKRKEVLEESFLERGWNNVTVEIVRHEYTAMYAKNNGVDYLFKGLRDQNDFNYENLIQQTNAEVLDGVKTLFMMSPRGLGSVSSSFVKALQGPAGWHWQVRKFVPSPAYRAWIEDWLEKNWIGLFGSTDRAVEEFQFLCGGESYGGAGRHYHNIEHLVHGLSEIQAWAANTRAPKEDVQSISAAFWYHDAVYGGGGNVSDEEASARRWESSGLLPALASESASLIRVTDHFQAVHLDPRLKHVMLGADLAILGQSSDVYKGYAEAIRKEYAHVNEDAYCSGRAGALEHLLQKAHKGVLFEDPWFAKRYQEQAISNLAREISDLRA